MADFLTQKRMPLAEFLAGAGSRVSASSWIAVTQAMIDGFADVTGDRQFIHIDPVRAAAETPFGGAIAHGFLTLSLLSGMAYEALPQPAARPMGINYGSSRGSGPALAFAVSSGWPRPPSASPANCSPATRRRSRSRAATSRRWPPNG